MMEDARECWASLQDRVVFKFVQCSSSVSSTCIPTVGGDRSKLTVQIPLPANIFQVSLFIIHYEFLLSYLLINDIILVRL